jgi:hypothetical protein
MSKRHLLKTVVIFALTAGFATAQAQIKFNPVDHSNVQRCVDLHRAAEFSHQNVWDCLGNMRAYPSITAKREAESRCNAEERARISPAVAAYRAECRDSAGRAGAVGQ